MVSPLRRGTFVKRYKSTQKGLPQHPAPSLRLGVPSLRHPSAGHRLRLASLAPPLDDCGCAAARYALPSDACLHSAFCNGAGGSKSKATEAAFRPAYSGRPAQFTKHVGASLLAMVVNDDAVVLNVRGGLRFFVGTPPGLLPQGIGGNMGDQAGRKAASAVFDFDSPAPLQKAEWRHSSEGSA